MSSVVTPISWSEVSQIVGPDHLHAATIADTVDGVAPQMVAEPGSAEELAHSLRWARDSGVKVAPRGGGTKLSWGNPPAACDLVLSTARLNRIIEHAWADMTVIAEAGCRIADLQKTLAEHRQHLALDPLWPGRATIGGVLSTNDSGSLRLRYGSLRDLIIGITVALPDGTLARSGGRVVKNVAGYDLAKLFTGAFGTLGVIVQAIFRLHPLPRESHSLSFAGTPQSLNELLLAIHASKLTPTGLQLRADPESAQLDIRFDGTAAGIEAQTRQVRQIAGSVAASDVDAEVWASHQKIWKDPSASLIAKFSVLPSQLGEISSIVERVADDQSLAWKTVAQSLGAGYLRLESGQKIGDKPAGDERYDNEQSNTEQTTNARLRKAFISLRDEVTKLGGTTVLLGCPLALKREIDLWGQPSDAQPLMARIKQRFDPERTLNPGRFVGGI